MANKLNYDSKTLLNVKFSPKEKGYDPEEVDQIFDNIISDYESLNALLVSLKNENNKQKTEIEKLKKDLEKANIDFATLKKQFDQLKKTSGVTEDNYSLVKKVTAYERILYKKGIDPKKALSDLDNC